MTKRAAITQADLVRPAYLPDPALADLIGLSPTRFRRLRARLEAEGFPKKDRLVGLTLAADVDAWLARRRTINDPVPAAPAAHHTTTGAHDENLSAF